ncbi:hypothetical protein SAMN04488483_5653 [Pseudomonas helmanticensis]|uniref:Uncharacterized protein n=1 Tax=Pseudomonas helmanticensis TaxID=1471381 RepID=A0ACD2UE13_9PSED|nr:hypothetical protein [Pseudomonas helmanticensis]SMQ30757.1 hypothetical protein SAMN04488483_5653 [Pseudomonas helmanticensis]
MEAKAFTGHCDCKSTYNGNPVGTDFNTERVVFDQRTFQATMNTNLVQMVYAPDNLEPGEHLLTFVHDGVPQLEYQNGIRMLKLTGTGKVTIGENLDTQEGTIDATYFDELGRLIAFKGTFSGKYE